MPGWMIPHRAPFFLPLLYPALTWRMDPGEKVLYLTFDDGPVPGPTEWILDVLAQFSIRATFFCLGDNIRKHPGLFRSLINAGHSIGNHTVNHVNGWKTAVEHYRTNVLDFNAIAAAAGLASPTRLFRPPYGRITGKQINALEGYDIIMWDVLSQDYNDHLSPEKCLRRTLAACRPGSIVVFHDSYKSEKNMSYALPRLIDHLGGQGYTFKQVPDHNRMSNA